MKVRNGFVSNSSSSSFLVIYKDVKDFDKFKPFNGYDIFIKDLNESNKNSAISFLNEEMRGELYRINRVLIDRIRGNDGWDDDEYFYNNNAWNHIPYDFHYSDKSIQKKMDELRSASLEGEEVLNKCYEQMDCHKEAKAFIRFLKRKGYKAVALEYEDDTENGAYMETRFMPFLKSCPEGDFAVYIVNCH